MKKILDTLHKEMPVHWWVRVIGLLNADVCYKCGVVRQRDNSNAGGGCKGWTKISLRNKVAK